MSFKKNLQYIYMSGGGVRALIRGESPAEGWPESSAGAIAPSGAGPATSAEAKASRGAGPSKKISGRGPARDGVRDINWGRRPR